jgi:hypothetical protein
MRPDRIYAPHGLVDAGVDIFASSGVTDGRGAFGYVLYVREEQFDKAARALDL